jgi:hypothetical protein
MRPAALVRSTPPRARHNQELVKKHYNDVFTIVRHLLAPAGASTIGFLGAALPGWWLVLASD